MFRYLKEEITKELSKEDRIFGQRTIKRALIGVIIFPVLLLWCLLLIVVGDWDANARLFSKWIYPNAIVISAGEGVDANGISILWKTELMSGNILLYKNGELVYDDFREQEDNYFTVLYQGQQLAVFDQVKKNGVYGHAYHFYIKKIGDRLQTRLSIKGRDTTFIQIQ